MIASKDWGDCIRCNKPILKGQQFTLVEGEFTHNGCLHNEERLGKAQSKDAGRVGRGASRFRKGPHQTPREDAPPHVQQLLHV